jgi:glyoxylase-like metal-dependent hydrolase (beta-lactamase superfamily II)
MKNKVLFFMLIVGVLHSKAQSFNSPLKIKQLTNDYYIFTTYNEFNGEKFPANGMYIVTNRGVVLLDTPWDTTQFQPLLDSIFRKHHQEVVLCIATHYHADRTAGLEFLRSKGVKTYTSKQTFDFCMKQHEKQSEFYFRKDTLFSVGEHTFETYYPGEGHTKDNIVIWCHNAKVLYGGCFIKSTESKDLGNLADANVMEWKYSVKKTMRKYSNPLYVIPGHLGWEDKSSLPYTYRLLKENRK